MADLDPNLQREIQNLAHYASGLLDAGLSPSQVVESLILKGHDKETAMNFVSALLEVRRNQSTPSGSPQRELAVASNQAQNVHDDPLSAIDPKTAELVREMAAFVDQLIDQGDSADLIISKLMKLGMDQDSSITFVRWMIEIRKRRAAEESQQREMVAASNQAQNVQYDPGFAEFLTRLGAYINQLLDQGDSVPLVVLKLAKVGVDQDTATRIVNAVLANRLESQTQGSHQNEATSTSNQVQNVQNQSARVFTYLPFKAGFFTLTSLVVAVVFAMIAFRNNSGLFGFPKVVATVVYWSIAALCGLAALHGLLTSLAAVVFNHRIIITEESITVPVSTFSSEVAVISFNLVSGISICRTKKQDGREYIEHVDLQFKDGRFYRIQSEMFMEADFNELVRLLSAKVQK